MDITDYIDKRTAQPDRPQFVRETKGGGQMRSRTIYINHENDWILRALVKAHRDEPTCKDALADKILTDYFHHNYPELAALYKERQAIDNKAIDAAKALKP